MYMIQTLDSVKKEAVDQGYQELLWQYNECVYMCALLNTYNHVILLLFPNIFYVSTQIYVLISALVKKFHCCIHCVTPHNIFINVKQALR